MSWQVYCDSNLIGTGKITRCAILGQQGGVWASSAAYELSSDEQANIVKAFSDPSSAQANGIRAAGNKFFTLAANDRSIYGKKAADQLERGRREGQDRGGRGTHSSFLTIDADHTTSSFSPLQADGIVLVKTNQAVLVAEYSHPTLPGEATKIVEGTSNFPH
ncbi:BZ3500_MvSof-1268-A1-R1_Chr8-1g09728 [Microbotryum saponariae]|uniref:Profilin n=1 Tax=Microbotryum saponariae TaxID=289078 RepID=A0A2X0MUC6_9BASI|nr:BZ3500_MvSof-1268-A1-R1_Chr8-1g09728 [Microbotryum saponariae]SDA08014.1 BZ3501_MvSof-1269-A2-R1_Chr8-1g09451 [Microbotryum saponariae]